VRRVRVVVVSAWEPWRRSDAAAFVLDHQLQILAARHDITVLAAGAPEAATVPPEAADDTSAAVAMQWFGSDSGRTVDYLSRRLWSLRSREPAHVRYVERPALVAALREAATAADVVHLHGWGTAALWQHVSGLPTVHMAIDSWTANAANRRRPAAQRLGELGQRRLIAAHERLHYPRLGAVIVVAERDAALVRAAAPGARVEVVPNGVDVGPDPSPLPARPVLGFHGVFDSQANVDAARALVDEILPRVRRTVPEAAVVLAGRRPPREVRALAGDGVELRADVPDTATELAAMTVHVDWMTSGSGIKNKVLEAMAAGRPVVGSPLAAEGIGSGPGLEVADTVEGAATRIADLLRDPKAAAAAGRAGRQRVASDFSWQTNADRVEALWAELAR
jgi:glycosyltransferase involved in cell wall biosynthesis